MQPHRKQPTKLPCPWDSPGKNIGVGCYCLLRSPRLVILKILQARLQQYMNHELPEVQTVFGKGRGTRDQIANILWIIEKAREFQENIYFCFTDYTRAFDCVDHNKLWKIFTERGIPDYFTCLLKNLYSGQGQEAIVRTGHGTTDWFQIEKGVHQGCILLPCLFNFICRVRHVKCQTA